MLDITFNLLLYQLVMFLAPPMFVLFGVLPVIMAWIGGDGYWANVKRVWNGIVFLIFFGSRNRK